MTTENEAKSESPVDAAPEAAAPTREMTLAEKNNIILSKITDEQTRAVVRALGDQGADLTDVAGSCTGLTRVLALYAGTWFTNGFSYVEFMNDQAHGMVAGAIKLHANFEMKKAEAEAAAAMKSADAAPADAAPTV